MGKIAGFVSKSERERIRLIREARATDAVGERSDERPGKAGLTALKGPLPPKERLGDGRS